MTDPKMESAPIVRATNCRVGMHVFTWARGGYTRGGYKGSGAGLAPHDTTLRCSCGAYDWAEWQKVVQPKTAVEEKP